MEIIPNNLLLNLTGKTAIITGGSMGIGYGIAYRLAGAGANVIIASRHLEEAEKKVLELIAKSYKAKAVVVDVSQEEDVKILVQKTVEHFGGVDILVNNAGIFPFAPLEKLTSELFDQVVAINLRGVFLCAKYVSEQMIKQGRGGKIINITSIDALHPSAVGLSHYDATKHAVWGFTKNIALELAQHKIWVNAVAPGGVMTEGVAKSQGKTGEPDNTKETPMETPMKRMGVPDDIGKVVLFLASEMSSYMTGSQIIVDGGYLLK